MRDGVDRRDLFETVAAVESVKFGKKDERGDLHAICLAIDIDCQRVKSLGYSFRRAAGGEDVIDDGDLEYSILSLAGRYVGLPEVKGVSAASSSSSPAVDQHPFPARVFFPPSIAPSPGAVPDRPFPRRHCQVPLKYSTPVQTFHKKREAS